MTLTERTRDRVMGGVFLVALAVIVLPMLFDGRGVESPAAPEIPAPAPSDAQPVAAMDPANLANADALRKRIDDDGFDRSTSTRVGDPVITPADSRPSGPLAPAWGVQLGSFADHAKAVALRDQLRKDGYQSVLTEVKGLTGVSTRVAVGPMINRDDATRLERELEKRYGMDVIVVVFGR
ncbi:MAG TPA: SPOR domain-containing protein [Pseudomonadales bacterium]|nr:SPOR domain-containing protein [Pseudomonadales bacterium]